MSAISNEISNSVTKDLSWEMLRLEGREMRLRLSRATAEKHLFKSTFYLHCKQGRGYVGPSLHDMFCAKEF